MHKEGRPNQALAPTGSQGREKRRAENDSTLGPGWATRLCGTYLGYGYRVIEVYPPRWSPCKFSSAPRPPTKHRPWSGSHLQNPHRRQVVEGAITGQDDDRVCRESHKLVGQSAPRPCATPPLCCPAPSAALRRCSFFSIAIAVRARRRPLHARRIRRHQGPDR